MHLKIQCDGESWKNLGFEVEVNKSLVQYTKPLDPACMWKSQADGTNNNHVQTSSHVSSSTITWMH